jgi:hypothetical protein
VMEIEPMRGLTLSKFQIIMRGLDLGMGPDCIGITESQRVADAGLESIQILRHVDENGRARCSSMSSICQFNVM